MLTNKTHLKGVYFESDLLIIILRIFLSSLSSMKDESPDFEWAAEISNVMTGICHIILKAGDY